MYLSYHEFFSCRYVFRYTDYLSRFDSHKLLDYINNGSWETLRSLWNDDDAELIDNSNYWDNGVFGDRAYNEFMFDLLLPGEWKWEL